MNNVRVQQKALSTALLHNTQDKKNKEMQNNTENEINEAFSENLFFLKTTNMISILSCHF